MAKTISEEELQLRKRARRRLIGAIALVSIIAVIVPMVLDHEPKPATEDITVQIPSSEPGKFTSKIVPRSGSDAARKSGAKPSPPGGAKAPIKPEGDSAINPPAHDTEAAPPKATAESKAGAKPSAAQRVRETPAVPARADSKDEFVVQVAALNDAGKAKQMQEQMAAAGIKSYTEVVPTSKGRVTRVRAGPFASRDEAEKMRERLKALGLAGNVVPRRL